MARRVHQAREDAEFDFILRMSAVPVLAYFVGTWPKAVEPCRTMDPVVGAVADAYPDRLTVVRADITRCPEATRRYQVAGAPSYVLVRDGEAVASGTGILTEAGIRDLLDGRL